MEQGVEYHMDMEAKKNEKYSIHKCTILSWISPNLLLCVGILCAIGYINTLQIYIRVIQVLVFFLLCMQIKHIQILYFLMLVASITFFYLLIPEGKVIYKFWVLRITDEALYNGIFRGLSLVGYVFLSLWCISPRLRLPTKFGKLLSLSIQFFNKIIETASDSKYRNFVKAQKQHYKSDACKSTRGKIFLLISERTDVLLEEAIMQMNLHTQEVGISSDITKMQVSIRKRQKISGIVSLVVVLIVSWSEILWGLYRDV